MADISTPYGVFTPQRTANELRRKEIMPVTYYRSKQVRSIPLEKQTVVSTPVGEVPAELVSFHENGTLNRVFPLNGKLSGYWSQEDEEKLAKPVTLTTPAGIFTAKIIGVGFHDNEALRSITLWPEETITVDTPAGYIKTRIGISFTRDGRIQSIEPAAPTPVETFAGTITAFDPDAVGVNADDNSLAFGADGSITKIATTLNCLKAVHPNGSHTMFIPAVRESLCGDTEEEIVPMVVKMDGSNVEIRTDAELPSTSIPKADHLFFAEPYLMQLARTLEVMRCAV